MLTVVKVGGGLAREAGDGALRALCTAIAEAGARHPLLVVPGGAEFADTVRERDRRFGLRPQTAHRMAILAMDQFGWALADLIPGATRCVELGPLRAGVVSVLLPAALLAERDPLPRVVGRHLGLDRRVGGRCRRRGAARAREAGRRPLPHLAAGRRADRAVDD